MRYLFCDEIDGWSAQDLDGEGDPLYLAERRTATYQRRKKIFLVSTPTEKSTSRIYREFEASDKRYYFVPCPHCGKKQSLKFSQFRWEEGKPKTVRYSCEHCEEDIYEHHKTKMLENGEWIATAESETRGYHLSSLYSPVGWYSWEQAIVDYERALKEPHLMKGFKNTVLGEVYEDEFEAPEWQRLYERRENYPLGIIPKDGLFLVSGVDIQRNRIELELVAYGRNKCSWSVDYIVLTGNTAEPTVWKKLGKVIEADYPHASGGTMPIRVMCIDSGYATQDVYNFVRKYNQPIWSAAGARASLPRTVVAVKGRSPETSLILGASKVDKDGKSKRKDVRVWSVSDPVGKGELYRWLKLPRPTDEELANGEEYPPGTCLFPMYGEEFFKQLTSEKRVTKLVNGYPKDLWEKDPNINNEALDCRKYARAAAAIYGLDRFREMHWRRLENVLGKQSEKSKQKNKNEKKKTLPPLVQQAPVKHDDPYL